MGDMANDALEGQCCAWCGVYFEDSHGYPVLCKGCFEDQGADEQLPCATEEEM